MFYYTKNNQFPCMLCLGKNWVVIKDSFLQKTLLFQDIFQEKL